MALLRKVWPPPHKRPLRRARSTQVGLKTKHTQGCPRLQTL